MDRVIKIVNYVMKQVLFQGENVGSERNLVYSLIQLGYHPEEIEIAFRLLSSIPTTLKSEIEERGGAIELRKGYRIFSPSEQKKLSTSCQGEIMRLMSSSLLTFSELEKVLTEALQMDIYEVGLKELELILHKVIQEEERLLMLLPHSLELGTSFLLN